MKIYPHVVPNHFAITRSFYCVCFFVLHIEPKRSIFMQLQKGLHFSLFITQRIIWLQNTLKIVYKLHGLHLLCFFGCFVCPFGARKKKNTYFIIPSETIMPNRFDQHVGEKEKWVDCPFKCNVAPGGTETDVLR